MHKEEIRQLPQCVQDYLNYLNAVKNHSNLTILEYASDLRTFFRYAARSKGWVPDSLAFDDINIAGITLEQVQQITLFDAYAFLSFCRDERENDAAARARKVTAIKLLYKYLSVQTKQIPENTMQELELPKLKKSLPKYLTLQECKDLLNSVDGPYKARDFCIVTLFLNCGMRLSELVSLNISDIRDDNTMRITGKGNKERTVYLNDACISAVNAHLRERPHERVKDRDALFLSSRNQRISPKTVQYIVKSYLDKSGLSDKGYSVHKLRHTAATLMYQYGAVDVLLIKEILGHENLSTTQIYTHVVDEQLRQATNANPLAGFHAESDAKIKKLNKGTVEDGIQGGSGDAEQE